MFVVIRQKLPHNENKAVQNYLYSRQQYASTLSSGSTSELGSESACESESQSQNTSVNPNVNLDANV